MANAKITQLPALTTQDQADLLCIVDDVAGTPVTKKITLEDFFTFPINQGMAFSGFVSPTTMKGGTYAGTYSSIDFDNPTDDYIVQFFARYTDLFAPNGYNISIDDTYAVTFAMFDDDIGLEAPFAHVVGTTSIDLTSPSILLVGDATGTGRFAYEKQLGAGLSSGTTRVFDFISHYTGTDLTTSDSIHALSTTLNFGEGGVASIGNGIAFANNLVISGSGDATNEFAAQLSVMRADLGVGFTQTGAPLGRFWFNDLNAYSPVGVQPGLFNGITMFTNFYYNGSPSASPSGGMWVVTKPGVGGGVDSVHNAATTYAMDVGVGVVGYSTGGDVGFTNAFKAGGFGSGWHESGTPSKIGNAFVGRDFVTTGLDLAAFEGTDFVAKFASDDGDDATDTWIHRIAATGNAYTFENNSNVNVTLTTAGAMTLRAGLTHGSTTLLTTSVALTNGAAAQVGTLTNAPSAGNPSKWIPINDNGTTRYIPAWT